MCEACYIFYYDKSAFQRATKANGLLCKAGLERFPVTPAEVKKIEPALQGAFYGGFYTPSDSTGDIHKFTRGLALACERRGARFRCVVRVRGKRHRGYGLDGRGSFVRVGTPDDSELGRPGSTILTSPRHRAVSTRSPQPPLCRSSTSTGRLTEPWVLTD